MFRTTLYSLLLGVLSANAESADPARFEHCFEEAASRHRVSADLLRAIAKVESSFNPIAVNGTHVERTKTKDIGLMQINTGNLRGLKKYGISETHLYDPCVSTDVGAWLLRERIDRFGYTWEAVGSYNAACTQLKGVECDRARSLYARKVARALNDLRRHALPPQQVAVPVIQEITINARDRS